MGTLVTMRTVAFAALVASAAAFAPALSGVRTGATSLNMAMDKSGRAPVITVFDHRGCTAHKNTDYTGPKANGMEDEQCVKVQSVKIAGPDADTVLATRSPPSRSKRATACEYAVRRLTTSNSLACTVGPFGVRALRPAATPF